MRPHTFGEVVELSWSYIELYAINAACWVHFAVQDAGLWLERRRHEA
jgi:hypothetical protein